MSATPARIGFILNPFRRAVAETADAKTKFGAQARQSEDPVESFFDDVDDAQAIADERQALLSAVRRRFDVVAAGAETGMALDFSETVPVARYIDTERSLDRAALVGDITIDLGQQISKFNIWG